MADTVKQFWIDPEGNPIPFEGGDIVPSEGATEAYVDAAVLAEETRAMAAESALAGDIAAIDGYTLPPAGLTTLGGVKRNTGSPGQYMTGFDADGNALYDTPAGGGFVATSVAYAATVTPDADGGYDGLTIGAMTGDLALANPSGTPVDWQTMKIRLSASGADRTITLGTAYQFGSTIGTNPFIVSSGGKAELIIEWDSDSSKWTTVLINGLA